MGLLLLAMELKLAPVTSSISNGVEHGAVGESMGM